jgi:hypothetical protein
MPLKKIIRNNKIFIVDQKTDSYLHHIKDDNYLLLVYQNIEENWKGYTNIKTISDYVKKNNNIDKNYAFDEFVINYQYYSEGIQYLDYEPNDNDAGTNYISFNLKKYLNIFEPDLCKKITKICKHVDDNNIIWL